MKRTIILAVIMLVWQLLLWFLFAPATAQFILSLLIWLVILAVLIWTDRYLRQTRFSKTGFMLLIPIGLYLIILLMPGESYESSPVNEIRSALQAWKAYDTLPEAMLFEDVRPPFAVNTAVLHRHQDATPEYSWSFRFVHPNLEHHLYLFNIRNNQTATSYPAMLDAFIEDDALNLILLQNEREVTYVVPLENPYGMEPYDLRGSVEGPRGSERYTAYVEPHYLEVKQDQPFQQLYWYFLDKTR